jgi:predicted phage-related endonuclease
MYDRSKSIGASDAVHIQAGQWAELYDRKTVTHLEPPEYGLAAEIGKRLEGFNLELFTAQTGREVHVAFDTAPPLEMSEHPWCKFLPDGMLAQLEDDDITIFGADPLDEEDFFIPIEAKCINMMWNPDNLLRKYMPQLQHAMRVAKSPYCIFSVLYLNTKYEWTRIPYDPPYDDALFEKEKLFQWFLETGTRPPQKKGRKWV